MTDKTTIPIDLADELQEPVEFTRDKLSSERWNHTVQVLKQTGKLLEAQPDLNCPRAQLESAALFHDLAKDMPDAKQRQLASQYLDGLDVYYKKIPAIWHGPASAQLVSENFDWPSADPVLVAVSFHSTGNPDRHRLSDALLVADFSSQDRSFKAAKEVRDLTGRENLQRLAQLVIKNKISSCLQRDKLVHPNSLEAYNRLCQ